MSVDPKSPGLALAKWVADHHELIRTLPLQTTQELWALYLGDQKVASEKDEKEEEEDEDDDGNSWDGVSHRCPSCGFEFVKREAFPESGPDLELVPQEPIKRENDVDYSGTFFAAFADWAADNHGKLGELMVQSFGRMAGDYEEEETESAEDIFAYYVAILDELEGITRPQTVREMLDEMFKLPKPVVAQRATGVQWGEFVEWSRIGAAPMFRRAERNDTDQEDHFHVFVEWVDEE